MMQGVLRPAIVLWFILVLLNLLDIWSTYTALNTQGAYEANPIANWLLDHNLLIAAKTLVLTALGIFCFIVKQNSQTVVMFLLVVLVYGYIVYHNMNIIV